MTEPAAGWVVSIDLSLASTALGAMHTGTGELHLHRVKSTGKMTDTLEMKVERYRALARDIAAAALVCSPLAVGIEGAQFATSKDTSAHRRAGLWWRTVDLIFAAGVPVIEVPPSTVKKWGTGKGNANKDMMVATAARRWEQVTQNDEADAAHLADLMTYLVGGGLVPRTKARDAILAKIPRDNVPVLGATAP